MDLAGSGRVATVRKVVDLTLTSSYVGMVVLRTGSGVVEGSPIMLGTVVETI